MTGGTVGKCFLLQKNIEKMYLNQRVANISSFSDEILIDYLYLLIQSPHIKGIVNANKNSTNDNISMDLINSFLVPLPPFDEQKRIVNKYSLFVPLLNFYDKKYCQIEVLNSKYKEALKKSILQYGIQGKLIKQNPNDEPADKLIERILDEKRQLMKDKKIKKESLSIIYKDTDNQFYEKFDDGTIVNITEEIPFDIPSNWCWVKFKNICKVITCGYASTPKYEKIGIPFISAKNIKPYKFMPEDHKFISEELYRKLTVNSKPEINDILLTRVGAGIGEAAIIDKEFDFAIYVSLTLIKLVNYDLINNRFILNYILSPYGVTTSNVNIYGKGASQGNLNVNNVRNFLIPIPPIKEQQMIVERVEKIFKYL